MTDETRARLEAWPLALADRDAAIRQARQEGATLREIAEVVGLSFARVGRIINKEQSQ